MIKKKIREWSDIDEIIEYRYDVFDDQGYIIPFIRFMDLALYDLIKIRRNGQYYFIRSMPPKK